MNKKTYNFKIRAASIKDIETIYQIEILSFIDAYPKTLIWQLIQDKNAICLIAETDQKIIGFAVAVMRNSNQGHIVSIAIDPEYRNLKFGSRLLSQLITALKEQGALMIGLEVRVSNEIAQKLYKKFNFHIKEVKKDYYSNGENAYLMIYNFET